MTTRGVLFAVWASLMACDIAATHAAPSPQPVEKATAPQDEVVTANVPTTSELVALFAKRFASPKLLVVSQAPAVNGLIRWTFTYDGVEIDQDAWTRSRPGGGYATRISPAEQGPQRVRRAKLISEATAIKRANVDGKGTAILRFKPTTRQHGRVVVSYRLVYEVIYANGISVTVDAYTGARLAETRPPAADFDSGGCFPSR